MGGGAGLGLFSGTKGDRERDVFPGGRLVAAAAQVGIATDAGSKPTEASTTLGTILEWLRPWWTYPYGHPEKTQGIDRLKGALKEPLEGLARGFIELDKRDPKSWIITEGSKTLSRKLQETKKRD